MNDDSNLTDLLTLTEEDLNKLGLREHPFIDHADESYLYTDSQLEMTANIIMEYLTNPATTIVLTGEDGIGKTTYLRKVLRLGYQQYQFCTLRANTETDFSYIESKIKQRWVLNDTNEHSSVADLSIENYVITYLREHTHAVLIIDDAHLLDTETLDRLFTLKHRIGLACPMSLGFIVAGENTLKTVTAELEDSNPACTQIYQINIRPFSHEQTKNYIEHRLDVAGLEGEILFDDAKITEIYKATSGNAKQIHEQAIVALKHQCSEDTIDDFSDPHITIRQPRPRVPVLLLTLIALVGIGLYINYNVGNKESDEITIPLETPMASEPTLSPIAQEANKPESEMTPSLPLPSIPTTDNKQINISNIENLVTTDDTDKNDLPSLLAESIETLEEIQPKEVIASVPEKSPANKTETSKEDLDTAKTTELSKEKIPVVLTDQTPQSKVEDKATYGEAWLKSIDSSRYTLQVVATKERKQLEALVKKENLVANYAYFSKPVKTNTYYVLVIGNYKNRDEAVNAISKLSSSLRKNKPWPVPVKNVQKFLK